MSCWLGRPLRLPALQAVTIALHCPPDLIAWTCCSRAREYPHQRDFTSQSFYCLPAVPPSKPDFYHNGFWRLFISHFRTQIHCHTLGYVQETSLESLHLMWDSCHEDFILGAPPTYFMALCGSSLEVPQNLLAHALTMTDLKHIGQLPVSLICTETVAHWEAVPPLSVNIFPASVTTLLSKLIYSSTKVIIFLNWYKYWINRINQMYSPGNLS